MSLVADYSDSEPDEECETNDVAVQNKANDKPKHDESLDISIVKQQKKVEDTSARESGNFLMSSEADSESSESDSDDTDLQKRHPTSRHATYILNYDKCKCWSKIIMKIQCLFTGSTKAK